MCVHVGNFLFGSNKYLEWKPAKLSKSSKILPNLKKKKKRSKETLETVENRGVRRLSVHSHTYLTVLWKVRYFSRSCGSEPSGRWTSR